MSIVELLNQGDTAEYEWALSYLRKKGYSRSVPPHDSTFQQLQQVNRLDKEAMRLFEAALDRHRKRQESKQKGEKNYNFFLSKKADDQLTKLRNEYRKSVPELLEFLIDQSAKDFEWGKREGKRMAMATAHTRKATLFQPDNSQAILGSQIEGLVNAVQSRDRIINQQINMLSELQAKLESWGLSNETPGPDYETLKAQHFKKTDQSIRLELEKRPQQQTETDHDRQDQDTQA